MAQASWSWGWVSAYRMTSSMLQDYFKERYGNYQFPIEVCRFWRYLIRRFACSTVAENGLCSL